MVCLFHRVGEEREKAHTHTETVTVVCLFHRVGEEREKAREELENERRDYEQQILKLVEQQEQILKERQGKVPLRQLTVRLT